MTKFQSSPHTRQNLCEAKVSLSIPWQEGNIFLEEMKTMKQAEKKKTLKAKYFFFK